MAAAAGVRAHRSECFESLRERFVLGYNRMVRRKRVYMKETTNDVSGCDPRNAPTFEVEI